MIIGIVHHDSNKQFLPALLRSLRHVNYKHRVVVVHNNVKKSDLENRWVGAIANPEGGYELGALKKLMHYYQHENDFFLLHNSTVIKDQEIFDTAAQYDGTLAVCNGFASFLAKYRRQVIEQIGLPVPQDRDAAIYWEHYWHLVYMQFEDRLALCDDPLDPWSKKFETKFGRKNMVLENKYLKKWKSNWTPLNLKTPL